MVRSIRLLVVLLGLSCGPPILAQEAVQTIEQEGLERMEEGQQAQKKVSTLNDDTRALVDEYHSHLKLVEGLKQYNTMLSQQLNNQEDEIGILKKSIGDVAIVERQILPLMQSMIEGLEHFIALDTPFLIEERRKRTEKLRELLARSDVTVAEKTRRVLEAYQIENDFGRTIETYKDKVNLGSGSFDADFLRIGRVALMYRIVGNGDVGHWDADSGSWAGLDRTPYKRYIEQGLKVANQEIAPELISIPVDPKLEVRR